MEITKLARETDTELAKLHNEMAAVQSKIAMNEESMIQCSNAHFYYVRRRRTTDRTFEEAREMVEGYLATLTDEEKGHGYGQLPQFDGPRFNGSSVGSAMRILEKLPELHAEADRIRAAAGELDAVWRKHRWSRFFLVVSSAGHIHKSMSCSTCRPTTGYGWVPELSGQDEDAAVEKCGPALCSVCFPSAPVEQVGGRLTKAQAAKMAA